LGHLVIIRTTTKTSVHKPGIMTSKAHPRDPLTLFLKETNDAD